MIPPPRTLAERVIRYGLAGLFATAVYVGAVTALVEILQVAAVPAAAIATLVVMVTSYAVNRAWVFDASRPHTSSFPRFAAATALSVALNTALMHLAVRVLAWPYLAGVVLTTAIVPPVNFVVNYLWSFKPVARDG
ncbi:MAG: GtrA family protein [Gemmatimonadota bacterium]